MKKSHAKFLKFSYEKNTGEINQLSPLLWQFHHASPLRGLLIGLKATNLNFWSNYVFYFSNFLTGVNGRQSESVASRADMN